MRCKKLVFALSIFMMHSILDAARPVDSLDEAPILEHPFVSCCNYFYAQIQSIDPIKDVILPVLKTCKYLETPIKTILIGPTETRMFSEMDNQHTAIGFLPFYTNCWCAGIRVSTEIGLDLLYAHRDRQKYHCASNDENHQIRVKKFSDCKHLFLKKAQECIEAEILMRQKAMIKWIEIGLDSSILFFESLYEDENLR